MSLSPAWNLLKKRERKGEKKQSAVQTPSFLVYSFFLFNFYYIDHMYLVLLALFGKFLRDS